MNNLPKKINVLITDGEIKFSLQVIKCLASHKCIDIHLLSKHEWVETRFSRHLKSFSYYRKEDIKYADDWKKIIQHEIIDKKIDVIFPVNVTEIRLLSEMQEELKILCPNFLLPSTESFDIANNKWELFKFLKENNLNRPETFNSENIVADDIPKLDFPVLVKPLSSSGGYGIRKIDSMKSLKTILKEQNQTIIQEFIHGYDLDMSVLCKDGNILAYTIQKGYMLNKQEYSSPYAVEFIPNDDVFKLVQQLMKKLNWSGLAHIDLRYDELNKSFKIIEINPRIWGSIELSKCVGIDFPYLYCLSSMKHTYEIPQYRYEKCASNTGLIKVLKSKLLGKKSRYKFPKNTTIMSNIKDPLPLLYGSFVTKLEKIVSKRSKLVSKFKHDVYCNFDVVLK